MARYDRDARRRMAGRVSVEEKAWLGFLVLYCQQHSLGHLGLARQRVRVDRAAGRAVRTQRAGRRQERALARCRTRRVTG